MKTEKAFVYCIEKIFLEDNLNMKAAENRNSAFEKPAPFPRGGYGKGSNDSLAFSHLCLFDAFFFFLKKERTAKIDNVPSQQYAMTQSFLFRNIYRTPYQEKKSEKQKLKSKYEKLRKAKKKEKEGSKSKKSGKTVHGYNVDDLSSLDENEAHNLSDVEESDIDDSHVEEEEEEEEEVNENDDGKTQKGKQKKTKRKKGQNSDEEDAYNEDDFNFDNNNNNNNNSKSKKEKKKKKTTKKQQSKNKDELADKDIPFYDQFDMDDDIDNDHDNDNDYSSMTKKKSTNDMDDWNAITKAAQNADLWDQPLDEDFASGNRKSEKAKNKFVLKQLSIKSAWLKSKIEENSDIFVGGLNLQGKVPPLIRNLLGNRLHFKPGTLVLGVVTDVHPHFVRLALYHGQ
ncbi:hypothetical protein RFI_06842, partial [Reticulomyxa filosa]